MGDNSKIQWTDASWNSVRGCDVITAGCSRCYAKTFAERFRGVAGHPYEQGFDLRLVPEKLDQPKRWTRPRKIFVNSMSDFFHEGIPDSYIEQMCRVMMEANWHTYQVLTKRAERMAELLRGKFQEFAQAKHILWGVSVENKHHGVPRIGLLRNSAAAKKFLSVEPLLEDIGTLDLTGIDWVIVGGESGPKSRPCNVQWIRNVAIQSGIQRVPCFVKQLGHYVTDRNDAGFNGESATEWPMGTEYEELDPTVYQGAPVRVILKDKKGGDMAEWPEGLRVRQFPLGTA